MKETTAGRLERMQAEKAKKMFLGGEGVERITALLSCSREAAADESRRIVRLIEEFETRFGADRDVKIFRAPGRTEICGNHTDHQGGRVLAAGINLDALAVVSLTGGTEIRVKSVGFPEDCVQADDTNPRPDEEGTSAALVRGLCAGLAAKGFRAEGFCACTENQVLPGSGLSSSAAFEVLLGTAMNHLFCGGFLTPLETAQLAQYAENRYFGKPCGLMDQAASAVGGFVLLDFSEADNPRAEKIPFDFSSCGYRLCIIDTKGSHSGLTQDYATIPAEMKKVAACFGKTLLSQVDEEEFYSRLPEVRATAGDRAALRAMHFFAENRRVVREAEALRTREFPTFLRLVMESGHSSFEFLQNAYPPSRTKEQGIPVALALCSRLLAKRGGAWRLHGGGFAGTVQAYVPNEFFEEFSREIESVFGRGSCLPLSVCAAGGVQIL
jgi:galactokinase